MLRINETTQPHGKRGKDITYPALMICCQEQNPEDDRHNNGHCPSTNFFQCRVDADNQKVILTMSPEGRLGKRFTREFDYPDFFSQMFTFMEQVEATPEVHEDTDPPVPHILSVEPPTE